MPTPSPLAASSNDRDDTNMTAAPASLSGSWHLESCVAVVDRRGGRICVCIPSSLCKPDRAQWYYLLQTPPPTLDYQARLDCPRLDCPRLDCSCQQAELETTAPKPSPFASQTTNPPPHRIKTDLQHCVLAPLEPGFARASVPKPRPGSVLPPEEYLILSRQRGSVERHRYVSHFFPRVRPPCPPRSCFPLHPLRTNMFLAFVPPSCALGRRTCAQSAPPQPDDQPLATNTALIAASHCHN
ncbi:hypothetical protein EV356DRAFT_515736 [Viridothelium virens]|uniref:Uncharacterized protein n=1 Tax=Viridothelium virens TaxID=1048519 RepID=A0A6A6H8E0_VIRVR|nr:hypothetical protein EV356DRAFT_515736 [Viridothelium virens]